MKHIRQKDTETYTVVITEGWDKPLEKHPAIVEHPEIFEVVDCDIPTEHLQYLNYNS